MGGSTGAGNGGVIVYVPGGRGRPAETIAAAMMRRGETVNDTLARRNIRVPRGARVLGLSGSDVAQAGGSKGFGDVDINDFLGNNLGRRLVASEARTVGRIGGERLGTGEETRAAANARRGAANAQRLRAELRQATARVRQLQNDGRPARTIKTAQNQADRIREQLAAQNARARGR